MNFKQSIAGAFHRLDESMQSAVIGLMSLYHVRDGKKHNDGSTGTIKITPAEFKDMVASFIPNEDGEAEIQEGLIH